jgi:ribosomal protein S18 acetylase RimI-like enzyme
MTYKIIYEQAPQQKDIEILTNGIALNAKKKRGLNPLIPFAFFIRDEKNEIKGGCNGNIGYDWLYVDQLWVDESLRGKSYGSALMQAAEKLAIEKKCVSAAVNTADWEALDFYKKLGYRVELERQILSKKSVFYFLRKEFI